MEGNVAFGSNAYAIAAGHLAGWPPQGQIYMSKSGFSWGTTPTSSFSSAALGTSIAVGKLNASLFKPG